MSRTASKSPLVSLGEFLRHPSDVGSAVPASQRMVRRMLEPLRWRDMRVFVEYGPGTGRFTRAALERLPATSRLIAIETGEGFVEHLRGSIADERLIVEEGSAADVRSILSRHGFAQADAILSGLPFSTLPPEDAEGIMRSSAEALAANGTFAAYQMRKAIEPLLQRHFGTLKQGFEWWNVPPCHLYWAGSPRRR